MHLVFQFTEKININDPNYFDFIAQKHGNLQATRSIAQSLSYISKFDPEPLDFGHVPVPTAQKVGKLEEIALAIKGGSSLVEIDQMHPGVFLNKKRNIEDYFSFQRLMRRRLEAKPWVDLVTGVETGAFLDVVAWFNNNMKMQRRPIKTPQLWLWGPPNIGKTTLLAFISRHARVYYAPSGEDFFDDYDDDSYDLALFDEFDGKNMNLANLRKFLDGQQMTLRKKGSQIAKRKNIPTVFLSNYAIDQVFKSLADKLSFQVRFLEVNIANQMPLHTLRFQGEDDTAV